MTPASPIGPGRVLAIVVRTLLSWSPVWISAILIWQFTTRGLRPAQAESQRLDRVAPAVEDRFFTNQADFEFMAAESEAWDDPVYRERQRRLRAAERAEQAAASDAAGDTGVAGNSAPTAR